MDGAQKGQKSTEKGGQEKCKGVGTGTFGKILERQPMRSAVTFSHCHVLADFVALEIASSL